MRVAILTSVDTRHRFFVNALDEVTLDEVAIDEVAVCKHFEIVAVGYEQTGYHPADASQYPQLSDRERDVVRNHFNERTRQEQRFFGHAAELIQDCQACRVLLMPPGTLNSPATLALLETQRAEAVVVYGTNLIRAPLLHRYAGRMLNMHLGLSPYYRGTATNFYPLLNEEPQYVGATIHLLDAGIDSGPIIHQARPNIEINDMPHTIGCKAILAGIEKMKLALTELADDRLPTVPQWPVEHPRLYLRKDFHPRQVVQLYQKWSQGLLARYLKRAQQARESAPIIE